MNPIKSLGSGAKTFVAGCLVAAALVLPLGVAASPAGATSAFCTALESWAKHPVPAPKSLTLSNYHAWAKLELPYYEKMAATAPNAATKTVLNDVVVVFKAYANYTSLTKLALYEKVHYTAFEADVKQLAKAIVSCYTGGITLP